MMNDGLGYDATSDDISWFSNAEALEDMIDDNIWHGFTEHGLAFGHGKD